MSIIWKWQVTNVCKNLFQQNGDIKAKLNILAPHSVNSSISPPAFFKYCGNFTWCSGCVCAPPPSPKTVACKLCFEPTGWIFPFGFGIAFSAYSSFVNLDQRRWMPMHPPPPHTHTLLQCHGSTVTTTPYNVKCTVQRPEAVDWCFLGRPCRSHYEEDRASLPRMYCWLLELFSFLLGVKEALVHEEVLRAERLLLLHRSQSSSTSRDGEERRKRRRRSTRSTRSGGGTGKTGGVNLRSERGRGKPASRGRGRKKKAWCVFLFVLVTIRQ